MAASPIRGLQGKTIKGKKLNQRESISPNAEEKLIKGWMEDKEGREVGRDFTGNKKHRKDEGKGRIR